jgi:caa(3)-type oxidase subunit IV
MRTYALVLAILLALTATVAAAGTTSTGGERGGAGIASVKATLVALFFMHLLRQAHERLIFTAGLATLAIFLMLCLIDVETRMPVAPGVQLRCRFAGNLR